MTGGQRTVSGVGPWLHLVWDGGLIAAADTRLAGLRAAGSCSGRSSGKVITYQKSLHHSDLRLAWLGWKCARTFSTIPKLVSPCPLQDDWSVNFLQLRQLWCGPVCLPSPVGVLGLQIHTSSCGLWGLHIKGVIRSATSHAQEMVSSFPLEFDFEAVSFQNPFTPFPTTQTSSPLLWFPANSAVVRMHTECVLFCEVSWGQVYTVLSKVLLIWLLPSYQWQSWRACHCVWSSWFCLFRLGNFCFLHLEAMLLGTYRQSWFVFPAGLMNFFLLL